MTSMSMAEVFMSGAQLYRPPSELMNAPYAWRRRRLASPCGISGVGSAMTALPPPWGRGKSGSLGVLDDRQDSRRHETSRAHDASVARQLADLDARARAAHLDAAAGARRLDDVLTRDAASGVDQNLDEISLCHTY